MSRKPVGGRKVKAPKRTGRKVSARQADAFPEKERTRPAEDQTPSERFTHHYTGRR